MIKLSLSLTQTRKRSSTNYLILIIGLALIVYQIFIIGTPVSALSQTFSAVVSSDANPTATAYPEGSRSLVLSNGTLVIVYTSSTADTVNNTGNLIYWAYSTDNGATWTPVSTGIFGKFPAVVKDGSDNLYLVYQIQTNANKDTSGSIYFTKGSFSPGPSYTWTTPIKIDNATDDHYPSIAVDSKGNLHVVYDQHLGGGNNNTNVRWNYVRGDNWGASWTKPVDYTFNPYKTQTKVGSFPSIVIDANNNLFVTWFDGNGSFYILRAVYANGSWTWDNSPWASFLNVGSPDSNNFNAMMMHSAIIKPGGGEIAVALPSINSQTGYEYQLYISSTLGNTPAWQTYSGITGSSPGDGWPSLAADTSSNYYVLLLDSPSGYSNLAYYKYTRFNNSLQTKQILVADPGGNNSYPQVMNTVSNYQVNVFWTAGSALPYSVRYSNLGQLSLSIDSTYNWDGTPGINAVNFGWLNPGAAPVVISTDVAKHAVGLTVNADVPWNLTLQAAGDFTGSSGKTFSIGQLQWRLHASTDPWTSFLTTPSSVLLNQNPSTGTSLRYDYRLGVGWQVAPDNYSTTITYTLAPKL